MLYKITFDMSGNPTTFFKEGDTISDAFLSLGFTDEQMSRLLNWEPVKNVNVKATKEQFASLYRGFNPDEMQYMSIVLGNIDDTFEQLYQNFSELPLHQQYYLLYLAESKNS